jgi:hypothetical protein
MGAVVITGHLQGQGERICEADYNITELIGTAIFSTSS